MNELNDALSERNGENRAQQPEARKIKVLIVEDSAVMSALLEGIIEEDPRLEVVATATSGEEAIKLIPKLQPDVISMDIRLPGLDGFETTRRIMAEYPTPIVVVSSHLNHREMNISFEALKAGALSVIDKPPGLQHPDFDKQARSLCTQLVIMSQVRVIRLRSRTNRLPIPIKPTGKSPLKNMGCTNTLASYRALGIVASTGGPRALATVLNGLGEDFPLPILLVQHITASFLDGFIDWLNTVSPLQASLASSGEKPLPGKIYLAPVDHHLTWRQGALWLTEDPHVSYQRPSGTVLLDSMALELGRRALGVVLTGMGDDGALGLLHLREAGGYTIAEAESTAVVYGMPGVAARLQAACQNLPLGEIAPHLREMVFIKE